jgi:hypothetical protein
VVFVAIGGAGEERGPARWAEAWLWLRGAEEVEAVRIGVADPLLLPKRVDPVDFLLERVEAWAMGRVAARGGTFDARSRRPVPDDDSAAGLIATLLGLAIDAPRLVERIEATTQWGELEDAAEEAQGVAEAVFVRARGGVS